MKWEEVKSAFDWDGSWRDLYVLGTTADDWRRLLAFVREGSYPALFQRGGVDSPLPEDPSRLFAAENESASLLSVDVGGVTLNGHFFEADRVELDLDPREVDSEERAGSLFAFMRGVGRTLGKPVRLTPENESGYVIFEYDPARDELRRVRE